MATYPYSLEAGVGEAVEVEGHFLMDFLTYPPPEPFVALFVAPHAQSAEHPSLDGTCSITRRTVAQISDSSTQGREQDT